MEIKREKYLNALIERRHNGSVFWTGNVNDLFSGYVYVYKEYKDYVKPDVTRMLSFVYFYYDLKLLIN